MDFFLIFIIPIVFLAIDGINCIGEKLNGHYLSYNAQEDLEEILNNCGKVYNTFFEDKYTKRLKRLVKPLIIELALESIISDIEKEGNKSKFIQAIEKEIEYIKVDIK